MIHFPAFMILSYMLHLSVLKSQQDSVVFCFKQLYIYMSSIKIKKKKKCTDTIFSTYQLFNCQCSSFLWIQVYHLQQLPFSLTNFFLVFLLCRSLAVTSLSLHLYRDTSFCLHFWRIVSLETVFGFCIFYVVFLFFQDFSACQGFKSLYVYMWSFCVSIWVH